MLLKRLSNILLFIILVEICLGGGGRLTAIGPVSLRMLLFGIALFVAIIRLVKGERIKRFYWSLFFFFILIISVGILIGLFHHHNPKMIWEDVKPLLYFLMLPFFALSTGVEKTSSIGRTIRLCSIITATSFFISLAMIYFGMMPFLSFYNATVKTEEFFYRGELSFFYKGFLFLGIGSIFFYFSNVKNKHVFTIALISAIVFSVTRGLLFALAGAFAFYQFFKGKIYFSLFAVTALLLVVVWGNQLTFSLSRWIDSSGSNKSFETARSNLFGERSYSDTGRLEQLREVKERVSFSTIIVGHGFGEGVPSRPVHMEISYLEIFHKQGLIGLAFWFLLAAMIYKKYRLAPSSPLAEAFFYTCLFIYLQSLTNQYINNPIGLSMLLLSLVCLDKMKVEP